MFMIVQDASAFAGHAAAQLSEVSHDCFEAGECEKGDEHIVDLLFSGQVDVDVAEMRLNSGWDLLKVLSHGRDIAFRKLVGH